MQFASMADQSLRDGAAENSGQHTGRQSAAKTAAEVRRLQIANRLQNGKMWEERGRYAVQIKSHRA